MPRAACAAHDESSLHMMNLPQLRHELASADLRSRKLPLPASGRAHALIDVVHFSHTLLQFHSCACAGVWHTVRSTRFGSCLMLVGDPADRSGHDRAVLVADDYNKICDGTTIVDTTNPDEIASVQQHFPRGRVQTGFMAGSRVVSISGRMRDTAAHRKPRCVLVCRTCPAGAHHESARGLCAASLGTPYCLVRAAACASRFTDLSRSRQNQL